jgi:hypothetical protein
MDAGILMVFALSIGQLRGVVNHARRQPAPGSPHRVKYCAIPRL